MMDLVDAYLNYKPCMTVETHTTYTDGSFYVGDNVGPNAPHRTIEDRLNELMRANVLPAALRIFCNPGPDSALMSIMLIYPGPKVPEDDAE